VYFYVWYARERELIGLYDEGICGLFQASLSL